MSSSSLSFGRGEERKEMFLYELDDLERKIIWWFRYFSRWFKRKRLLRCLIFTLFFLWWSEKWSARWLESRLWITNWDSITVFMGMLQGLQVHYIEYLQQMDKYLNLLRDEKTLSLSFSLPTIHLSTKKKKKKTKKTIHFLAGWLWFSVIALLVSLRTLLMRC